MLNVDEIEQEIAKIENGDTTYLNLQKLTYLYVVRDHLEKPVENSTEFQKAVAGKSKSAVYKVFDALMTELSTVNPTIYNRTMRKLNGGG